MKVKCKILHVITSMETGGAQVVLRNYLRKADRVKYSHVVYYFHHGPMVKEFHDLGVNLVHITGIVSPYDPVGIYHLVSMIRQEQPDLIHASLWSATMIARIVSRLLAIPVLCDLHADVAQYDMFRRFIEKWLSSWSRYYRAIGVSVKQSFVALSQLQQEHVFVIENGVDTQYLEFQARHGKVTRESCGLSSQKFVLGTVGRLVALKNYDHILDALSMVSEKIRSNIELCVVGDGPERFTLEDKARELGLLSQVCFMGNQQESAGFYRLFDCFILPSATEGVSCALLEALAMGVPVITTGVNRHHDVITHHREGYVLLVGERNALACSIQSLWHDRKKAREMGRFGQILIDRAYKLDTMVKKQEQLYQLILSKK